VAEIYVERLRGWALVAAREKRLCKRVMVINFYPPGEDRVFARPDAFDRWVDEIFIPEKIAEAQVAELVQAEDFLA
jgi:hypothetical protein